MKKALIAIAIIITVFSICSYYETHYTREAVVIDIEDENTVVVEDTTGNIWDFQKAGFQIGDNVKMKMWTHCTNSYIYDDEIQDAIKLR